MKFTKMHGIGNDYVYVNGFEEHVADPASLAVRIADRHCGVGGDGLILILPPRPGIQADVRMRMFNADGSESEMCGNGVRCVAKFAVDHRLTRQKPLRVETGRGVLTIDYTLDQNQNLALATVDMGSPILKSTEIPVRLENVEQVVHYPLKNLIQWPKPADWIKICEPDERMTCVSMGNPHLVLYCQKVDPVPLEQVGPLLENHAIFPRRINVHFVQVLKSGEVIMRTWERGSGITQACGTGACAVCVAGVLTGRTDRKIIAHLPGGDLSLEWNADTDHVLMTGPATEVFSGEWPEA